MNQYDAELCMAKTRESDKNFKAIVCIPTGQLPACWGDNFAKKQNMVDGMICREELRGYQQSGKED